MLERIKYFQAVVRNNSFSEAAAECNISQSAISQQVRSLENELGFALLVRKNRKFTVTPAGEYFYKKSLILVSDYKRLCTQSRQLAGSAAQVLRVGYLNSYGGNEFYGALGKFARIYPDVEVKITGGSHEALFKLLRSDEADIIFSDQRRAFSEEYINLVLAALPYQVLISANSPLASLNAVSMEDLKNTPCILPVSIGETSEQDYFRDVLGVRSEFIFADNTENARLLVISGSGFMLDIAAASTADSNVLKKLRLIRANAPVMQNLCAFWKKENQNAYAEKFAVLLEDEFAEI